MYSSYQKDAESEAFKQVFETHQNAVKTAVKRTLKKIDCYGRENEEMLKEDLERNVTLCHHNSFCRDRETSVDPLP